MMPYPSCGADNLSLVLLVIHYGADAQAHNCERGHLFRCVHIRFWERINILWVRDRCFDFAPGHLIDSSAWNNKLTEGYTNSFVVDLRIFDLKPTRSHDLPFENKKLKGIGVCAEYPSNIWALCIHRYLRLYEGTHYKGK
jgi:hypothetical protein